MQKALVHPILTSSAPRSRENLTSHHHEVMMVEFVGQKLSIRAKLGNICNKIKHKILIQNSREGFNFPPVGGSKLTASSEKNNVVPFFKIKLSMRSD